MKSPVRNVIAAVGLPALLALAPNAFAHHPAASADFGTPVHSPSAEREIQVGGFTKWVNVSRGETVRFVVDGKSFTWQFDTRGTPVIEFAKIAPAGLAGSGQVMIYVGPNPQDQSA